MSNVSALDALAEIERRLSVEGEPVSGYDGPGFDAMEAGYRDAARMVREYAAELQR